MTWQLAPNRSTPDPVSTRVRWWRSLRVTIAAATTVLTAIVVVSSGLVTARLTLDAAETQLRAQAVAALDADVASFNFGGAPPTGAVLDPALLPDRLRRDVSKLRTAVTYDDGTGMWAAQPLAPTGVFAIRIDKTPLQNQTRLIARTLLLTLLAATVIAATISWLIADRITARLRATAASVNRVIAGEPALVPRHRDEVGVLTAALAHTAAALTERLHREQAFTADVAHDLRTPLTALVSAAELLDDSAAADRVRRQVTRMRVLVEELLELARADLPDATPPALTEVSTVVRTALRSLDPNVHPHLDVHEDASVTVQVARLSATLRNLIVNADQHGTSPICVTVHGLTITVRDHGPGFPPALLTTGPTRFQPGAAGGAGLGLAIVVEHCRALGAVLHLANHPDGGAVARIDLPADLRTLSLPIAHPPAPTGHRPQPR